ncbi:MAG: bifunctional phosphoglucose/phosphomannose isomerase [Bacteroidetes bacterium]|nr:bifunctional phosphoglucose/phosphomannose isomerase [Bacteroidota bacterium]
MKQLVENFTLQLQEALDIAGKASLNKKANIQHIVITGLGGSGIGGTIMTELAAHECPYPVIINKDYFLPEFIGPHSLVIVSSYSGNTEETISAMQQAIDKKAQIICVTSGGRILDLAKQHGFDHIIIPGGNPPRSCIGYSLIQLIKIFQFNGFVKSDLLADASAAIALLNREEKAIQADALILAKTLHRKIPVIYSLGSCEGVAVRFRQQVNENSKMLCWHHTFPEMNHNELVGWAEPHENMAVVTFRTTYDYKRTVKRYDVCKPIFEKQAATVTDIMAKGSSRLEQFLYHIHLGDWASCYMADLKGVDATEVDVITRLKNELANF